MRAALLCFLALASALFAQTEAPPHKLTVLVKDARPFAFDKDGSQAGYTIDLWTRVAAEAHLDYEFKTVPSVPAVIEALRAGKADVGVGALSITAEREDVVDFSYPFYRSGIQILANTEGSRSPFRAFLKLDVLKILGLLLFAIAINAHILWFSERAKDSESFPREYVPGILNAAWWSVCILITLGCENIAPTRVVGRLLAVVWMLAGVALYSYVTATLASTMTVNTLQSDVRSISDLQRVPTGTVAGSSSARFLTTNGVNATLYPDLEAVMRAMNADEVKAVVYDAPLLRYYLGTHAGSHQQLVGDLLEREDYGFAVPEKSPLRKAINRALLKLDENGDLDELDKKWFPKAAAE